MKTMLVALGLFILGFGGIAAFSGGLPAALFDMSKNGGRPDDITVRQPVTLADFGDVVENAYERMLGACSAEDRKTYGRAMNALVVAKRDLEERVRLLRIANKSLDDHVAGLVDEREDLLETREELTTNLATTLDKKRALANTLKNREQELAVTAAALVS